MATCNTRSPAFRRPAPRPINPSVTELRDKLRATRQELEGNRSALRPQLQDVTAEHDAQQQQQPQPHQQPQQPPQLNKVALGQNQCLENLLTTILDRTTTATPAAPAHNPPLDFETQARLKAHRIPVYRAKPGLEVMIRFTKAAEHHVRPGGGSGDGSDAKHLNIAWTHLDNMTACPWFVTWIGKAPWFISEMDIAASQFSGCTWEAFTAAFRAQFGCTTHHAKGPPAAARPEI